MKEKILGVVDTLLLITTVFLWVAIEGILLYSWFLISRFSVFGWVSLVIVNGVLIFNIVYYRKIKRKLLVLVACATAIGIFITGITFVGITNYSKDFTPEKWKNYPAGRARMIDNLEEEHNLVGMGKGEIIELLGEPNYISQKEHGYETYEYYRHREYGVGGRYIVNFDKDGMVCEAYYYFDW